jgi:isoleucyl-tRNA synthetase
MDRLLAIRAKISQAVEKEQKAGGIGSALEAGVRVTAPAADRTLLTSLAGELEELFILSDLAIAEGDESAVEVSKTPAARCERCWRHRQEVGKSTDHPTLCARCEDALGPHA